MPSLNIVPLLAQRLSSQYGCGLARCSAPDFVIPEFIEPFQ
ncbi:hypothetical protein HNQ59_002066 [Chitinivorax tropicus]|uniref:Uncharacterized protein n=1 Tax=Chitinivorax tropicus TaxID=714531 RepID=A0A840MRD3_9PROT|nr:hypothetical protein [Chitinivorax tropicus]